jgi:tetratricopeptide (TPR) repeat protein
MMRSILFAAVAGVLAAVPASYFLTAPARQDGGRNAGPRRQCCVRDGHPGRSLADLLDHGIDGGDCGLAALDPEFAADKRAIVARDWTGAINALMSAGLAMPIFQNYLGYAYRRLRQVDPAMRHYRQALMLNPRHQSAQTPR